VKLSAIKKNPNNPRSIRGEQFERLKKSITEFPQMMALRPIVVDAEGVTLGGNMRLEALKTLGFKEIPDEWVKRADELTEEQKREFVVKDNAGFGDWDWDELANAWSDLPLIEWGLDLPAAWLEATGGEGGSNGDAATVVEARQTLAERFIIPPFTVLDARQGYWQDRKRAWIGLGLRGELGRGETALDFSASCVGITDPDARAVSHSKRRGHPNGKTNKLAPGGTGANSAYIGVRTAEVEKRYSKKGLARSNGQDLMRGEHVVGVPRSYTTQEWVNEKGLSGLSSAQTGTSIIDPVLCEIMYRWFAPPGGHVINPTAGEATYGIVAAHLGYKYTGVEIRPEQSESNREQAREIGVAPVWIDGDGRDVDKLITEPADFIMCCPPYADLEVYSDDPRDLSTMEYDEFLTVYRDIIANSLRVLKQDRFACFVVGDVRDKRGVYRNFPAATTRAFVDAGAELYNEAVLVTAIGSLPIRVGRQFEAARKLGKTHQNVLIYVKGDPRKATAACGPVETWMPEEGNGQL
jgi:hypothetical protein